MRYDSPKMLEIFPYGNKIRKITEALPHDFYIYCLGATLDIPNFPEKCKNLAHILMINTSAQEFADSLAGTMDRMLFSKEIDLNDRVSRISSKLIQNQEELPADHAARILTRIMMGKLRDLHSELRDTYASESRNLFRRDEIAIFRTEIKRTTDISGFFQKWNVRRIEFINTKRL